MPATRRLAAILAADVTGYSRLIGADEQGTLGRLRAIRTELIDPSVAAHLHRGTEGSNPPPSSGESGEIHERACGAEV